MLIKTSSESRWLSDYENNLLFRLLIAYVEARRGGKRGTYDEHNFEINAWENLVRIRDSIIDRTYTPGRSTGHIIHNPVMREIFAATFPDRVVQHLVYDSVIDFCDRQFIYDSYSCREGKGTDFGIKRLQHHINSVWNNGAETPWAIQLDMQGYFMSLPRKQLYNRTIDLLNKQFKDNLDCEDYKMLKFLWHQILMDDPCDGVKLIGYPEDWKGLPDTKSLLKQPPGVGIVIGNLTSQLSSNIYLNQLDWYVTKQLGFKHYGRYVDDFYIIVAEGDLDRAKKAIPLIEDFSARIGLTVHPNKRSIQPAERGVKFLGAVVRPGRRTYPGNRIRRNAEKAFSEVASEVRNVESVISYMGHLKHMRSRKFINGLIDKHGGKMSPELLDEITVAMKKILGPSKELGPNIF